VLSAASSYDDGKLSPLDDAASIPASLRGYVQLALNRGLINTCFAVTQGRFDLQPTLHAYFDPGKTRDASGLCSGGRSLPLRPSRGGRLRGLVRPLSEAWPGIAGPFIV